EPPARRQALSAVAGAADAHLAPLGLTALARFPRGVRGGAARSWPAAAAASRASQGGALPQPADRRGRGLGARERGDRNALPRRPTPRHGPAGTAAPTAADRATTRARLPAAPSTLLRASAPRDRFPVPLPADRTMR